MERKPLALMIGLMVLNAAIPHWWDVVAWQHARLVNRADRAAPYICGLR